MAESKLVQLNFENSSYNVSMEYSIHVFSMLRLGRNLISHLVVADLFVRVIPGLILLNLAIYVYAFLNHAHTSHRLACAWFFKIASVRMSACAHVCVCLP